MESQGGGRTAEEWARYKLVEFMRDNDIDQSRLNHRQEIVLVGAGFDDDTKSACAWMAKYGLPFRVIEVQPIKHGEQYFLNVSLIIPPSEYEDFYVDLVSTGDGKRVATKRAAVGDRKARIRLDTIMDYKKVNPGDAVFYKQSPEKKATLIDSKRCKYQEKEMSVQAWAKEVTGWSSVNIYEWVIETNWDVAGFGGGRSAIASTKTTSTVRECWVTFCLS